MKKLSLLILMVCTASWVFSQVQCAPDERIYDKYSNDRIERMMNERPQLVCLKNFELDNGYFFTEVSPEKAANCEDLYYYSYHDKKLGEKVMQVNEFDFNLYECKYERFYDRDNHYQIGNSNKVLIIISHKSLTEKFNEYYEKLNK